MNAREFRERFSRRARKAGITVPAALSDGLWVYFQLLAKWNAKINLTGLDLQDPTPEGIDRLLIEPLIAAPYAEGATSLIDIGSGGGSPALPLALALRGVPLVMIEVKTRKSVFLREAARELGLHDARVVTARHESLLADPALIGAALLLGHRIGTRPHVVVCGVVPLTLASRDTAPYGMGLTPLRGPVGRLRNAVLSAVAFVP